MKKKVSKWKKNREQRLSSKKSNIKIKLLVLVLFMFLIIFFTFNRNYILNNVLFTKNTYQNKNEEFNKIKSYPNLKIKFGSH